MSEDLRELLQLLNAEGVEYMVVGAHAVGFYSRARFTEDVDLWVRADEENALRLGKVLKEFGTPVSGEDLTAFSEGRKMITLGAPPNRVDLLNFLTGVEGSEPWLEQVTGVIDGVPVPFISKKFLIQTKSVVARPQDLADLDRLKRFGSDD